MSCAFRILVSGARVQCESEFGIQGIESPLGGTPFFRARRIVNPHPIPVFSVVWMHSFDLVSDIQRIVFHVQGGLADVFGFVAGGLQKGFDLLPGNEDFAEGFARTQIPPLDEPPNGLGATIEGGGGLVDVISQGLRQGSGRR